jgi:hypothetical protein
LTRNKKQCILQKVETGLYQDVVTHYHTRFYFDGFYPTDEEICEKFAIPEGEFLNFRENISKALVIRGLDPLPLKKTTHNAPRSVPGLDPFFVLACDLMVDTLDKRSASAKLKAIGLTTTRWKALLQKEDHKEYFSRRLEATFRETDNAAKLALSRNVEAGDLQSIKYFHEVTGIYRPNEELLMNVGILVGKIMEILAKRVEPAILAEIAEEFDTIGVGELNA